MIEWQIVRSCPEGSSYQGSGCSPLILPVILSSPSLQTSQLTLYAQKFDEFQATLAKSNEIYSRFKKEMNNVREQFPDVM